MLMYHYNYLYILIWVHVYLLHVHMNIHVLVYTLLYIIAACTTNCVHIQSYNIVHTSGLL